MPDALGRGRPSGAGIFDFAVPALAPGVAVVGCMGASDMRGRVGTFARGVASAFSLVLRCIPLSGGEAGRAASGGGRRPEASDSRRDTLPLTGGRAVATLFRRARGVILGRGRVVVVLGREGVDGTAAGMLARGLAIALVVDVGLACARGVADTLGRGRVAAVGRTGVAATVLAPGVEGTAVAVGRAGVAAAELFLGATSLDVVGSALALG